MTKAELRSLVKNYLRKIDNTNKYHNNVIDHSIEHAINQVYNDLFKNNPGDLDDYTKAYGATGAVIAVAQDANTGVYYSTIPAAYIPLRDKASGIRHIRGGGLASTLVFYPGSRKDMDLLTSTDTYDTLISNQDYIMYIVKRVTVEYKGSATTCSILQDQGVMMDILVPFTAFDDTDTVILPFGQDMKVQELAMVFLQQIQEPDLKDDN